MVGDFYISRAISCGVLITGGEKISFQIVQSVLTHVHFVTVGKRSLINKRNPVKYISE